MAKKSRRRRKATASNNKPAFSRRRKKRAMSKRAARSPLPTKEPAMAKRRKRKSGGGGGVATAFRRRRRSGGGGGGGSRRGMIDMSVVKAGAIVAGGAVVTNYTVSQLLATVFKDKPLNPWLVAALKAGVGLAIGYFGKSDTAKKLGIGGIAAATTDIVTALRGQATPAATALRGLGAGDYIDGLGAGDYIDGLKGLGDGETVRYARNTDGNLVAVA